MSTKHQGNDRARALGAWLACTAAAACTAAVDDDDPFATVGNASGSASGGPGSTGAGPADDGSTGAASTGSSGSVDGSTGSDGSIGADTSTGACDPPCDPLVAACEAGQCVAPGPPGPGQVVIAELMPNPALVTDDVGEWIELVNVGDEPVDLEGCVLYGDVSEEDVIDTGAPVVVPPGGLAVLGKVADAAQNGGVPGVAYAFGTSYSLTNTGDRVQLDCAGATVDEVDYADTWPFDAGVALQLSIASLDAAANDLPDAWCMATAAYGLGDLGTPGQPNAGC